MVILLSRMPAQFSAIRRLARAHWRILKLRTYDSTSSAFLGQDWWAPARSPGSLLKTGARWQTPPLRKNRIIATPCVGLTDDAGMVFISAIIDQQQASARFSSAEPSGQPIGARHRATCLRFEDRL